MEKINFEDIAISTGIRQTANEDGAVLLDIEQGICFALNPVGLKIWEMLKRKYSFEQVTSILHEEFGIPREELAADVLEFVAGLEAKRLVSHGVSRPARRGLLTRFLLWKFGDRQC